MLLLLSHRTPVNNQKFFSEGALKISTQVFTHNQDKLTSALSRLSQGFFLSKRYNSPERCGNAKYGHSGVNIHSPIHKTSMKIVETLFSALPFLFSSGFLITKRLVAKL